MIGLTTLEVYNSFFNITEEKNKLELYTDKLNEFAFEELKDQLEEIVKLLDKITEVLKEGVLRQRNLQAYKNLR